MVVPFLIRITSFKIREGGRDVTHYLVVVVFEEEERPRERERERKKKKERPNYSITYKYRTPVSRVLNKVAKEILRCLFMTTKWASRGKLRFWFGRRNTSIFF